MGKETSEGGKVEDLEILSASSLARKRSNQDFMCRAHFPFGIFFRRSGFCLNNNFPLWGAKAGSKAQGVACEQKKEAKWLLFRACVDV